ncbi:hypothetical protein J4443_03720 [Candidatus Woesearchaeota archaeon]|nr:hypothetical protein [Candidatus Woesearchaeota archaeon]
MKTENIICAYEYEIIDWIKENYKLIGYDKLLEENKNKIPDLVMLKNGKKANVEVEIYSSSFVKHKHNPSKIDEVLCLINDSKLSIKTIKIKQLKLWYHLQGNELVDFFKALPDTNLIDHRCNQTIYHHQKEWLNLSEKEERRIRENLEAQSRFLNTGDPKELKEKAGDVFD